LASRTRVMAGSAFACLLALTLSGCLQARGGAVPAPAPVGVTSAAPAPRTEPVAATASPQPTATPEVSSGPIVSPGPGSAERTAILAAARERLQTSSPFLVAQLYVQGDVALADLLPQGAPTTARRLVGATRTGGSWTATWDGSFSAATAPSIRAAMPYASAALVAKVRLDAPLPIDLGPLRKSATAAALTFAKAQSDASVGTLSVIDVKLAQDHKGVWWASAVIKPSNTHVDNAPIFLKRVGSSWTLVDFGTGIDPSTDTRFPAEVRDKL
jgi:hypothetical protein